MATAVIQSFSANATVIAARLYTAEACVEAITSTAGIDCEMAMSAPTQRLPPRSHLRRHLAPWQRPLLHLLQTVRAPTPILNTDSQSGIQTSRDSP